METLQIKKGTWAAFNNLATKDPNTIYFITDARRIYIGNIEFTRPTECMADLVFIDSNGTNYKTIEKDNR